MENNYTKTLKAKLLKNNNKQDIGYKRSVLRRQCSETNIEIQKGWCTADIESEV